MVKMKEAQVSSEYLDSLCEWMEEWIQHEESLVLSQFLSWKGIGYPYFKYFLSISEKVSHTFEVMKHILCNRWIDKVLDDPKFPLHKEKLAMRYIRLYDSHALDVEQEIRQEISKVKVQTKMEYIAENYGRFNSKPTD